MKFFNEDQFLEIVLTFTHIVVILIGTIVVAKLAGRFFTRFFNKSSRFIKTDPTNYNFVKYLLIAVIYNIGTGIAISVIPALKTLSVSLFTGAGILAAILGFASQQAFSNIVSGIFIVIFKPFRVGDRLEIRNTITGMVEDITLRHTVLRSPENKMIFIPNSVIQQEIIINADIEVK